MRPSKGAAGNGGQEQRCRGRLGREGEELQVLLKVHSSAAAF